MGAWGVGLFENDDALDVRDAFNRALRAGASVQAATATVLAELDYLFTEWEYSLDAWLALADLLLRRHALPRYVQQQALLKLDEGDRHDWFVGEDEMAKRHRVFANLRRRLLAAQPVT